MKKKQSDNIRVIIIISIILIIVAAIAVYKMNSNNMPHNSNDTVTEVVQTSADSQTPDVKPEYLASEFAGEPFVIINDNKPFFTSSEIVSKTFERYGELDSLGRCTACIACISYDNMPTEKRESISAVKPTGWQSVTYDIIPTKNLYNRAHLIGYQLGGNAGDLGESKKAGYDKTTWKRNLITGTRYLNVEGMLPFENMVADYIKEYRSNHVMYRVTPVFVGNNLLAEGVLMEGYSVEDRGEGIEFCVFCYNVQPGIVIDYKDGSSHLSGETQHTSEVQRYIVNTSSKKIHLPECDSLKNTKESNKQEFVGHIEDLLSQGYERCGSCKP